jgi:hypothetical protein
MKIENKANNSCPYCGSEAKTGMIANSFWKCGNATTDENRRSELCREREAHNNTKRERDDARKALEHIVEYWNRDENETSMSDALWHIIQTAVDVLHATKPDQLKEGAK